MFHVLRWMINTPAIAVNASTNITLLVKVF